MAPLAGYNNLAFRLQCRRQGNPGFVATEMISAKSLAVPRAVNEKYLIRSDEEGLLQYQIWGTEPELIANATQICEARGADLIDINCGCPVRKVIASGSGVAFMKDPEGIAACVQAMRNATALPISIKIRIGYDAQHWNGLEVAQAAAEAGIDFITIHGRHGKESYATPVRMEEIGRIAGEMAIPVFGNGDVRDGASAARMVAETGCDGVMVARACMGNPWVFDQIQTELTGAAWSPPTSHERGRVLRENYEQLLGLMSEDAATRHIRKLACFYSKGVIGSREFRLEVSACQTREHFHELVDKHFRNP
jgi:nifR3 family TIM-barrel protein